MQIILDDNDQHLTFAPLSLTRPIGNLRMGIFTNDERYKQFLPAAKVSFATEDYIQSVFPLELASDNIWVNAAVIPNKQFIDAIINLESNTALYQNGVFLAGRNHQKSFEQKKTFSDDITLLTERWHLFQWNDKVLRADFELIQKTSATLSNSNKLIGNADQIFVHPSAKVEGAIINVNEGPVYIGPNAEIMEGTLVRGSLALCEGATLKMGAKIYGATTIGPHCKVGGEINNVIFQSYSNKGHDGFLGNTVIGEWCNLGADTNTSNLKNNYGMVKAYDYRQKKLAATGVQFMGLMMGDHAKAGINTMFNTATVVGVAANVFNAGFPPKFIPDFAWGGFDDTLYDFDKAMEAAENMMQRRNAPLSESYKAMLFHLFKQR
jgi:UDP-N-acetylglucosamine diphosphorylase/glucosamine-1-phosphate N-acetyltransferase